MAQNALFRARNAKLRPTIGIGTRDHGICRHPVVRMRGTLFGREEWQNGSECIHRKASPFREDQVFTFHQKALPHMVVSNKVVALYRHFEVIELKGIIFLFCHIVSFMSFSF